MAPVLVFALVSCCLPTLVCCWVAQDQGNSWSARRRPTRTDASRTKNDNKLIHRKNGGLVLRQSSSQEEEASSGKEQDSNERRQTPGAAPEATTPRLSPVPEEMTVEDATDLTTLVGPEGEYEQLVTVLFKTEVGNVRWRSVKGQTKDSFVKKCANVVRDELRSWIKDVGLEGKFEGQQDDEESALAGRSTSGRLAEGVSLKGPSILPRDELVELVLKLASEKEMVVLMGPSLCGKSILMQLIENYCDVKETTPDGKPTPATLRLMVSTKFAKRQIMQAVRALNRAKPWEKGDPYRILLLDDIENVDPEFWLKLINEGFAGKEGVRIVGALTYQHVGSPSFSPLLQEDSTTSFSKLPFTQEEQDQLLPNIMKEKTHLNRLDEASRTAIVNAVLDQCQGHIFAIMESLDALDEFARLRKNQECHLILSYFRSKEFLGRVCNRIWPKDADDFTEQERMELQDAIINDQKVISAAVQSRLQNIYFVLPETEPKARTWPQIKQESTFKLATRQLYSSLFPNRAPEGSHPGNIEDLVKGALKSFHRVDLLQSCSASEANFPKEAHLQKMFYIGLVSNLPASTEIVSEMSAILPPLRDGKKGELDFYVDSKYSYGIELMREGANFKEHKARFLQGGKYDTPKIAEYRIVDFRRFGFQAANTDPSRLVIEFQSEYQGCNVWSGGKKASTISFL